MNFAGFPGMAFGRVDADITAQNPAREPAPVLRSIVRMARLA